VIQDNIEFFNVEELEKREDGSTYFYRFPKDICDCMGKGDQTFGRYVSKMTTGCELRFIMNSRVAIKLSAFESDGNVVVFFGDFFSSVVKLQKGVETVIMLNLPANIEKTQVIPSRYPYNLCRIVFCHDFCGIYRGVDTYGSEIYPYKDNHLKKWIAYGSSITHSSGATLSTNGYIYKTAKMLGVEVINKGMGGSCLCEKEVSDHIISICEWDFATLELGINMLKLFSLEEFTKNVQYLVREISNKHKDKKIFLITIFPFYGFLNEEKEKVDAFSNVLRQLSKESKNLILIEGTDVLKDFTGLTCDLVHPSDDGHSQMAYNLYNILKEHING
jgi:hypothetical protein